MKIKHVFYSLLILIFFQISLFAENTFVLAEKAKSLGMTFYWDSLSETGMLEKNGHQLTFRNNESIVVLDSV